MRIAGVERLATPYSEQNLRRNRLLREPFLLCIGDTRADLNLQIALLTEYEVTQVLKMLDGIEDKLGVKKDRDGELTNLEMETKPEDVLAEIAHLQQLIRKKE
jgi:hypothetical protein